MRANAIRPSSTVFDAVYPVYPYRSATPPLDKSSSFRYVGSFVKFRGSDLYRYMSRVAPYDPIGSRVSDTWHEMPRARRARRHPSSRRRRRSTFKVERLFSAARLEKPSIYCQTVWGLHQAPASATKSPYRRRGTVPRIAEDQRHRIRSGHYALSDPEGIMDRIEYPMHAVI